jgi:hypothetical protein
MTTDRIVELAAMRMFVPRWRCKISVYNERIVALLRERESLDTLEKLERDWKECERFRKLLRRYGRKLEEYEKKLWELERDTDRFYKSYPLARLHLEEFEERVAPMIARLS